MCGIAGFTHSVRRLPTGVLSTALQSIVHRGPDSFGRHDSPQISLGATRLRILDLEAGDQPLKSADGDVVVVFNGEIFNHQEIRGELEHAGFQFRTRCDTEVVLNAYLHWGQLCFARFRGMFAVAVWIQSERRLILARDRMGIKPLYYCVQEGEVFFGSELKCLFAHPGVRRHINLEALDCFLSLNYVPGPMTLVDGIVKLMPGHTLVWHYGHADVSAFGIRSESVKQHTNIDDACEELDHLLSSAVREQLVADTPVGIWLSGGLDSSSVLHYAAKHSRRLRTFSITFKKSAGDESEHIQRISRHYGTDHTEFDLNPNCDLPGAIEDIAYHSDEPGADAGALPMWFLSRMTRQSATVALSGEGSDELFAGYLTYQADRYSASIRRFPRILRRAALAFAQQLPAQNGRISLEYKVKRFLQGCLLSPEMAHVFWNGTQSERDKRMLYRFADSGCLSRWIEGIDRGIGLQRFLDFDQRYFLADDILYKADRMSMAHSLEVRPPFLDPRIVDFAAAIPEEFKLHGKTSKYVLRRLMAGKLPAETLERPKVGFDIPAHDWFRGPLQEFLLDTLSREAVEDTGLFHWAAVERLILRHLEKKENAGYQLWGLLVLMLWIRRWGIELPAAAQVPEVALADMEVLASSPQLALS